MSRIRFLSQTPDSVTLSRSDYKKLVEAAQAAKDLEVVAAHRAYEDRLGWETARQNYLTAEETRRLLDGESPIRVWREKRGLAQRVLAEAAKISASYLAEIELGKKPGSADALHNIANILNVPMELISETPALAANRNESPIVHSQAAAQALARIAEFRSGQIEQATRAVVNRWRREANRDGLQHQLRATLESTLTAIGDYWPAVAREQDAIVRGAGSEGRAERDLTRIRAALQKAVQILKDEAKRIQAGAR